MKQEKDISGSRISEEELVKLIDEYQAGLLKHAFYMLGSGPEAEDVVQDVFVKFYLQSQVLSERSKTKAYLYRMVSNACIDLLRKRKPEQQLPVSKLLNIPEEQLNGAAREVRMHKEFLRINRMLLKLPPEQAAVIRLHTLSDLSFAEIARILELPVTTVKSRFSYGLNKLRKLTGIKKEVYDEL